MPQPVTSDLHVDVLLSMLSIAYMNEPDAFIADEAFPVVPVAKQSNKIAKYDKEFWFRDEASLRAPAQEAKGGGYTVNTSDTYFCSNYAYKDDIPDELRENYDQPFDPDNDSTALVTEKLKLRREVAWATDFFKTTVWGATGTDTDFSSTPTTQWSDYANSDPIGDVETGREAIYSGTGKDPNKLIIGRAVLAKLKHHPDLVERIKYTQTAILSVGIIASLFDVEKILVGKAIKNTTKEAASTQTYSYIFGKSALMLYTPARPGLRTPSAGYTFQWSKFGGISYIRRIRDDKAQYDRIEGHTFFDQKAIATDCGYFMYNVVA
jgi:hypothetical protein